MIFKVSEQFTKFPGGRLKKNGDHSGEELRDDYIIPLLENNPDEKLIIDFDGIIGIAASTIDEVFYGLARKMGKETMDRVEVVCSNSVILDEAKFALKEGLKTKGVKK